MQCGKNVSGSVIVLSLTNAFQAANKLTLLFGLFALAYLDFIY